MAEKTYIVRFKPPETSVQPVVAAAGEIEDDYLVFLHEDGSVSAFFLAAVVESWSCESSSE